VRIPDSTTLTPPVNPDLPDFSVGVGGGLASALGAVIPLYLVRGRTPISVSGARGTMSRSLTAAIRGAENQVVLAQHMLRAASMTTGVQQRVHRLAARYILGNVDGVEYDIMLRLQVLEGAARVTAPSKNGGTWWKKGRRGLRMAKDHYKGTNIDPSWFSTSPTGMVSKTLAMIRQAFNSWTKGRGAHFTPEDLLQNAIMGLTKDGDGLLEGGPVFFQTGYNTPGLVKNIPSGKDTPQSVAGVAAQKVVRKINDEFKKVDRNTVPSTDDEGRDVIDVMSADPREFLQVLADLVQDPNNPARAVIKKYLGKHMGETGRRVELVFAWFLNKLNGNPRQLQQIAKEMGVSSGTITTYLNRKGKPAFKKLQNDRQFKGEIADLVDVAQMRLAQKRLASRFMSSPRPNFR